jgi:DNA repair protein RecN (Recombination protein N)
LIDAVNLALGGRADRELIRTGEERARVQALFDVSKNTAAKAFLDEMALETDGGLVAVSREITRSGRSVARIAGQIMPIATVRAFTAHLVDVHGQHEHQSLFDPAAQLGCVDGFDEQTILPLREKTAQAYRQWRAAQRALKEFAGTPQERAQQMDMLAYQIQEIDAAQLQAGEDEQLAQRRLFFKNAQKVADAVSSAKQALESSALDAVLQASRALLSAVGAVDARYGDVADQLADSYYTLKTSAVQVAQMADELDYRRAGSRSGGNRWELLRRLDPKIRRVMPRRFWWRTAIRRRTNWRRSGSAIRPLRKCKSASIRRRQRMKRRPARCMTRGSGRRRRFPTPFWGN